MNSTASNLRVYFSGEVSEVSTDGPIFSAKCESLSWIFDRAVAKRLYQQTDNWPLFSAPNGLTASDWQWNATVVSYDAAACTLVVGSISANNTTLNGATDLVAHYFAAGYLQVVTGAATQYRMIGDSTAVTAGQIALYLTAPLVVPPVAGNGLQLFAGYDGQYETAIDKFNNGPNFGGFPFIPVGNPFVMKISQNPSGGKK